MKKILIAVVGAWFILIAFSSDKSHYVVYQGEKYYKCGTEYAIDTVDETGGITIYKTQIVYYDHFLCK